MLEISFSSPSILARRSSRSISNFGDLNELHGKSAEVSENRSEDDEGREREERETSTSIRSSGSLPSSLPSSFSDVSSTLSHEQTLLTTNSTPRSNSSSSSSQEYTDEKGEEIESKGEGEGSCDRNRGRALGSSSRNNDKYDNNNMVNTTNHNSTVSISSSLTPCTTTSSASSIGGSNYSECSTSENSGNSKSIRLNGGIRKNGGAAVGGSGGSSVALTSYLESFYAQCREREANDRDNCVAALRSLSHWNGTQWTVESEWHRSRRMEEKVRTYQEKYLYFGLPNDKVNNSNEGWRKGSNGWWRTSRGGGGRRGENSTSRSQSFHLPYHQKVPFQASRSMPSEKKKEEKEEEVTWICGSHVNNSEESGVSKILLSTHETSSSSSSSISDSRMGEKRKDEECQTEEEMGVNETTYRRFLAKSPQLLDERQPKEEKACEYDEWDVARPVLSSMRRDEEMIEKEGKDERAFVEINRSGLKEEEKERCEVVEGWNEEEETEVQEMEEAEEKIEEVDERKEENKIEGDDEKQKKQEVNEINRNEIFDGNCEKVADAAEKKRKDEKEQMDDDVVKQEEFQYLPNHGNHLPLSYIPSMRVSDVSTKSSSMSSSSNSSTTDNNNSDGSETSSSNNSTTGKTSSDSSETSSINSSTTCNTSSDGSEITDSDDGSERILFRTTNSSVNSLPDYNLNEQIKHSKLSKNEENFFSFPDIFVTPTDEMRASSCSTEEMPGDCSQPIGTLPSSSSSNVSSSLSYLLSSASLINLSSLLTSSSSTFPNLINLNLDLSPSVIPETPSNVLGEAQFMRRNEEGEEEEEGGIQNTSSFISLRNEEVESGESYRGEKRVENEGLEGRTDSSNDSSRGSSSSSSEEDGKGEMQQHEENGKESHSNMYSKNNIDFRKSMRVGQQNEEEEEWRRPMNFSSDDSSDRERANRSTSTSTSSSKMVFNAQYLLGPWTSILTNNNADVVEK